MITLKEFLKIFAETGFERSALRDFYRSVRKTIILSYLGRHSWPEILRQEEKYQWPILRRIDDPDLPLYQGADKALLDAFIKSIVKEKDLRAQKGNWRALQELIEERAGLFKNIFDYSKKDTQLSETVAQRYKMILDKKTKKRRTAWGIGIGAGAAAAAGAAAFWYASKRDKK